MKIHSTYYYSHQKQKLQRWVYDKLPMTIELWRFLTSLRFVRNDRFIVIKEWEGSAARRYIVKLIKFYKGGTPFPNSPQKFNVIPNAVRNLPIKKQFRKFAVHLQRLPLFVSFVLIAIGISVFVTAQTPPPPILYQDKNFEFPPLPVCPPGNPSCSHDYQARDYVELQAGFQYSAQPGQNFHAGINKDLVLPADYAASLFTDADIDGRTINTALPVGAIPGSAGVSPTGAATYSVPIYVPPGTAGMQPNLSIVYNSQGGNGLLGMGWNLAGLSAITRVNKNIYNDTKVEAIHFNSDDRFALDGNLLIETSASEYKTEVESFSKVTSNGSAGNGPDWFLVETKAGLKMEFGNTTGNNSNSKLLRAPANGSDVIAWYINKIYDNYGNYFTYTYANDGDGFRIQEINYTGNSIQAPYNSIKFYYDKRTDVNTFYIAGEAIKSNVLLREIDVFCEGQIVKKYKFTYGQNILSYLMEIEEKGADNTSLNSTRFKYGDDGTFSEEPVSSIPATNYDYIVGDFNGDGKDDFVTLSISPMLGLLNHHLYSGTPVLYINQGNNSFTQYSITASVSVNFFAFYPENNEKRSFIQNMDLNGDGKSDLLLGEAYPPPSPTSIAYTAYFSTGTDFIKKSNTIFVRLDFDLVAGDFDGNGTMDVAYADHLFGQGTLFYYDKTTDEMIMQELCGFVSGIFPGNSNDYPVDINGDGKTEILTVGNDPVIQEFHQQNNTCTGIGNVPFTIELIDPGAYPDFGDPIFPGDFNGDGKTDLFVWDDSQNKWKIDYATGTAFNVVDILDDLSLNIGNFVSNKRFLVADADGNGMSDIIKISDGICNGNQDGYRIFYYLSDGMNFTLASDNCMPYSSFYINNIKFPIGDFNGDGKQDIGLIDINNSVFSILYYNKNGKGLLLHKILDGFNFKTSFNYSTITDGGAFYTKYNNASYTFMDFQGPLPAVSSITVPDGIGGANTTNYSYEGALIHKQGKGFLGFQKVTVSNSITGIASETKSELLPVADIVAMFPCTVKTFTTSGTNLSETIFTNTANTYGDRRYYPYQSSVETKDFTKDKKILTSNFINADGNADGALTLYGSAASWNIIETENTTNTWIQKGSWIPNRLDYQTTTRLRVGNPNYTVNSDYGYNGQGSLTLQVAFENKAKKLTTEYAYYNTTGNLLSAKTSASGMDDRSTSYEYDMKGRFVTKATNPLNHIAEAQYDSKWGKPLIQKGINDLTTTYEYDGFGNLTKMKTPDGLETDYERTWDIDNTLHSLFFDKVTPDGVPSQKTWYDIYGRALKTETDGFDNQPVFTLQTFNNKGQLASKTLPFDNGSTPVNTTYAYYTSGFATGLMQSEVNSAVPGATSYGYSGTNGLYTVSVTNPASHTSSQITDASGKVVSATDNGGTLTYTYFSNGQTKDITLYGQTPAISSMTYDDRGFQTTLNDANAGTMTYVYNAFGELTEQTDAHTPGNHYTMTYNKLGQIESRTLDGESPTTWQYYPIGPAINQPRSITAPNGNKQTFTYDYLGRIHAQGETIDGNTYSTSYQYNNFGNISKITYHPSGFAISRNYDQHGYLTEVRNAGDNSLIWQGNEMNALGQYTKYLQGNGCHNLKEFDSFGRQTQIMSGTNSPYYNNINNLQLSWNQSTGNLTSRYDMTNYKTETFTYDLLNRLKTTQVTGQPALTTSYESNGNIDYNDLGDYIYSTTTPNAVEKIQCGNIPYAPQQDISYTAFNKTCTISEGNYHLEYFYGPDQQRKKNELKNNGTTEKTIIYAGNYEEVTVNGSTYKVHYIAGGSGLTAIYVTPPSGGGGALYYVYTDHLGSILTLTDAAGNIVYETNFDAWGRERNPNTWDYTPNPTTPPEWLIRGFTGHEHLKEFALINMNGRVYDPVIGRVLSSDNYVLDPFGTQGYNTYSYAFNNPLRYTDPDGEFVVAFVVIGVLLFTDIGYDIQKYVSPVAVKVDLTSGTNQRGIGLQASVGVPQIAPLSARAHGSVGYYWKNMDITPGWQTTYGYELGALGLITVGSTHYNNPGTKFDQTTGHVRIGIPGLNVKYENDWFFGIPLGDNGDRYRTAAAQVNAGIFSVGLNLFTGDPGMDGRETEVRPDGYKYYIKNSRGNDPDEYRAGIGYIGIGPFRFGNDRESRRHKIQNELIHDKIGSPRFTNIDRPNKFYFQFGSGGGFLW